MTDMKLWYRDLSEQKCNRCKIKNAEHWLASANIAKDWEEVYCLKCFVFKLGEMHDIWKRILESEKQ